MAYATLFMKNPYTGHMKQAPVGYSWTSFFFSGLTPLFRGDIKWGLIWLILAIFTAGFSNFVQGYIYNKQYIKRLIEKGYKVESSSLVLDYIANKMKMPLPTTQGA